MKITVNQLRRIIKEEVARVLNENENNFSLLDLIAGKKLDYIENFRSLVQLADDLKEKNPGKTMEDVEFAQKAKDKLGMFYSTGDWSKPSILQRIWVGSDYNTRMKLDSMIERLRNSRGGYSGRYPSSDVSAEDGIETIRNIQKQGRGMTPFIGGGR